MPDSCVSYLQASNTISINFVNSDNTRLISTIQAFTELGSMVKLYAPSWPEQMKQISVVKLYVYD